MKIISSVNDNKIKSKISTKNIKFENVNVNTITKYQVF